MYDLWYATVTKLSLAILQLTFHFAEDGEI